MTIEHADWADVAKITRETFDLWSPGLSEDHYRHYIWRQITHSWARQHFRYVVLTDERTGAVAASCKLNEHIFLSRGREYRVLGIGSVYVQRQHRRAGHGRRLIESVKDSAQSLGVDGLLLFTEIGPEFYEQFGFEEMGSADFLAHLNYSDRTGSIAIEDPEWIYPVPVETDHIDDMLRIYGRWRARQVYALERSALYLDYKLGRERYLAEHSRLSWPRLHVLFLHRDSDGARDSYALIERAGPSLRILEMISSPGRQESLWLALLSWAKRSGIRRIRGWESQIKDLAPSYELRNFMPDSLLDGWLDGQLNFFERDWGRPMLLAFTNELESWFETFPCPLLELDHL